MTCERFQNGEPIRARPVWRSEKAWRWCRRNPSLAVASSLAMAALVAVAVVSLAFALEETRTKNQIKGLANDLQSSLEESEILASELKTALKESEIRLAALNFERGPYRLRERGDGPGPAAAGRELALGRRGPMTRAGSTPPEPACLPGKAITPDSGRFSRMARRFIASHSARTARPC